MVVSARGRTVPDGRSKEIRAPEGAQVRRIHVREAPFVRAGAPLVDLDPLVALADQDRLRRELEEAQLAVVRLEALLDAPCSPGVALGAFKRPDRVADDLVGLHRRQLTSTRRQASAVVVQSASADLSEARR
jgi:hemolysin D